MRLNPSSVPYSLLRFAERGEVLAEMRFEHPIVDFLIAAKRREERLTEIGMIQNRAESDVQYLARMEVVEQRHELVVGQFCRVRRFADLSGDVIAGAVNRVTFARESGYLAEEFRI